MARFLSAEWFEEVDRHTAGSAPGDAPDPAGGDPASGDPASGDRAGRLVIEQVVRATPDGDVRYRVVVGPTGARIIGPGAADQPGPPDLTITSDWATATALAKGELSAQAALAGGRLRIGGNLDRLSAATDGLAGRDALPDAVRRATTFDG